MFNAGYFRNINKAYYSGMITKLTYMRKMINTAIVKSKEYEEEVNVYFAKLTGGPFIRVSWEECGYPSLHMGKKKYIMIPHETLYPLGMTDDEFLTKYKSIKLFIRGIEIKKKGNSQLLTDIGYDIWKKSFDPFNTDTLMAVVSNKIKEVYTDTCRKDSDFIMSAAYKPVSDVLRAQGKGNTSVLLFVDRMAKLNLAPAPYERFRYIMAKKYPFAYDIKGRKRTLMVGERMEYPDRAKELGIEIDMDYYMTGKITGELARYIRYHPSLHIQPKNIDNDVECHDCDEKSTDNAKKHILKICSQYNNHAVDKGPIFKQLYKETNNNLIPHLESLGLGSILSRFNSDTTECKKKQQHSVFDSSAMGRKSNDEIFERFVISAEKHAEKLAKKSIKIKILDIFNSGGDLCVKRKSKDEVDAKSTKDPYSLICKDTPVFNNGDKLEKLFQYIKTYQYMTEMKSSVYDVQKNIMYGKIKTHIIGFKKTLEKRDEIIKNIITKLIEHYGIENIANDVAEDFAQHLVDIKDSIKHVVNKFISEEMLSINKSEFLSADLNKYWYNLMASNLSFIESNGILDELKKKKKLLLGI